MSTKRIESFGKEETKAYKEIAGYKWNDTFKCTSCGCEEYFEGKYPYSRRCMKCKKDFSPTVGTIFQGVRFPLHIALYIVWVVANESERITIEKLTKYISDKFKQSIRQKTVWAFVIKVYSAMPQRKMTFDNNVIFVRITLMNQKIFAAKGFYDFRLKLVAIVEKGDRTDILQELSKNCKENDILIYGYDVVFKNDGPKFKKRIQGADILLTPMPGAKNESEAKSFANDIYRVIWDVNPNRYQAYLNFFCFGANGYKYEQLMNILIPKA